MAMEYSPRNAIPYVSRVDAGPSSWSAARCEIVSSGDLIQVFEAAWDDEQGARTLTRLSTPIRLTPGPGDSLRNRVAAPCGR